MSMCNKVRGGITCRSKTIARYVYMSGFCLKFNIAALTKKYRMPISSRTGSTIYDSRYAVISLRKSECKMVNKGNK